ncbi:unnamed protein product [Rotaria sp. Silwood2]|nr:unnamed protein product [Rotaria sp. Silwood2]
MVIQAKILLHHGVLTILKVVLPVDSSQTGVKTLIEISMDILQNSSSSLHTRVAVLIFLSSLLSNSSSAVQALLSVQNGVSYIIAH